jgi:hypothetical protein
MSAGPLSLLQFVSFHCARMSRNGDSPFKFEAVAVQTSLCSTISSGSVS